jgi:hypothetical protein
MKRECILELKTQGFVDQLIEDLAHCNQLMSFEGLDKTKSLMIARTQAIGPRSDPWPHGNSTNEVE